MISPTKTKSGRLLSRHRLSRRVKAKAVDYDDLADDVNPTEARRALERALNDVRHGRVHTTL